MKLWKELEKTKKFYFIVSNKKPYVEFCDELTEFFTLRLFTTLKDANLYSNDLIEQESVKRSLTEAQWSTSEDIYKTLIPFVLNEMKKLFKKEPALKVVVSKLLNDNVVLEESIFDSRESIN